MPEFDFFVSGIEDGIIAVISGLKTPTGYLKTIDSYGGELDEKTLKSFVDQLAPMFPLVLVAYGDGDDVLSPVTSVALGEPRVFRHDCTFSVICCSDDARGETRQRKGTAGVYKMLADTRKLLAGIRFRKEGELLTLNPLTPNGVEYIARLPGLTAYAAHFETYFKWQEPDRRDPDVEVTELIFEVDPLNAPTGPGGLPGVLIE
jgi:hypothetical protein